MEAFLREAHAWWAVLGEELATAQRASRAGEAELRFILGLAESMPDVAPSEELPPGSARTVGLGRHVADHGTPRPRLEERLGGREQWFFTLHPQPET